MNHDALKLLHVISGRGDGGSKKVFLAYHQALQQLGHQVQALVRSGDTQKRLEALGEEPFIINYSRLFITPQKRSQLLQARDLKAWDAIIVHNSKDARLWSKLAPQHPLILIIHSEDLSAVSLANIVVTVNPTLEHAAGLRTKAPVKLIPNPSSALPARQPSSPTFTFGYLGKIRRAKGIFLLLRALSLLQKQRKDWRMLIQGNGPMHWPARFLGLILGLRKHLCWKPWGAASEFFNKVETVVVPSYQETFSLVVLEALQQSKKLIATPAPGPAWILKTLACEACLCQNHDPKALAEKLSSMMDAHGFPTPSLEMIDQHFGMNAFLANIKELCALIKEQKT